MDARQQKTLARLSATILDLASRGPVSEVTVSALAAAAGVHRSTVYEYAPSPAALLESVLRSELDALRTEYLVDVEPSDAGAAVVGVTRAVLRHVDDHDIIYRRGLGTESGAASLHAMLSEHFQASIDLLLDQHSLVVPADDDVERRAIARYLADGTIGAIDVWLTRPRPRDVDAFLALVGRLTPAWWPGSGGSQPPDTASRPA
ncbi:DNA-binding transcriptional regulator, AcrR family [Leifsonia sp. 98AMF]|uniref:TetR/AcrR family transcriptional regulator n=1 Tax=unclassified Leifsonia TaxID=2663824 RepID=UPI00087C4370|nr:MULTISPECIES: TetR/AcrR family transcriptional regulator [unclassified Leifsonia]SDH50368.1 DNA-binding transcriptional regulator, AcrR family [Leifsonia sp. 197AMF]SDI87749.1 DNA-binding transcriptional regulator, AcrR family [Leifsonia sp. 466MF]SDJ93879.1 DNA-binding transcriptional regulator, AcrR family [Leifsonia sp. 157MF]SDN91076.1 DNA-binding transcriptional regulator, AcrR family [Leifsonia sp. 509MF]SEN14798.1 DNA-binding transcriptional regulator, AcrR family [Leifsonia sp. 467M